MPDWEMMLAAASAGSESALARTVTALEAGDWQAIAALGRRVAASDQRSERIGLTGAAGAGKSTLLAALSRAWPATGLVGGIAVDPSSDISGGAVLGDRFRLYQTTGARREDDGRLFLRSMAARGLGGALSRHVGIVASLLEEVGLDPILLETAGAGQGDTAVRRWVDCLVLVLTPESGDVVQMLKAGLMEWADIYVVNKADRQGAEQFASHLRGLVASQSARHDLPPAERVHLVQADHAAPEDLAELIAAMRKVAASDSSSRHALWEQVIGAFLEHDVVERLRSRLVGSTDWAAAVSQCASGRIPGNDVVARFVAVPEDALA